MDGNIWNNNDDEIMKTWKCGMRSHHPRMVDARGIFEDVLPAGRFELVRKESRRNKDVLSILLPGRFLQVFPPNMQNQPYLPMKAICSNSLIQVRSGGCDCSVCSCVCGGDDER